MNDQQSRMTMGILSIAGAVALWFLAIPVALAVIIGAIACWPLLLCVFLAWLFTRDN